MLSTSEPPWSIFGPERKQNAPHSRHSHVVDAGSAEMAPALQPQPLFRFPMLQHAILTTWIASKNRTLAAEIVQPPIFEPAPNASLQLHFYNESPSEMHNSACRSYHDTLGIDASPQKPNFAFRSRNYSKIGDRPGPIFAILYRSCRHRKAT